MMSSRHHQPEAPKFLLPYLKQITLQASDPQPPVRRSLRPGECCNSGGIRVKRATSPLAFPTAMWGRDNWTSQGSQSIQGIRPCRGWFLNRGLNYIIYLSSYPNYFTFIWSNCSFSTVQRESNDRLATAIRYSKQAHVNAPTSSMSSVSKHKDQVE